MKDQHKRFCEEYIKDLNGTEAAIRSGYSVKRARSTASDILQREDVKLYLNKLKSEVSERNKIQVDEIVDELANVVRFNPKDLFDDEGKLKPMQEIKRNHAAAIDSIIIDNYDNRQRVRIRLHNKIQAGNLLLKHLGGFEKDNSQRKTVIDLSKLDTKTLLKLNEASC